jgi:hypothetical protein
MLPFIAGVTPVLNYRTAGPRTLWPVVFVDALTFGQHTLMQDARTQNAADRLAVKDNVSTVLHSPKSGTNIVTHTTRRWVIGKHQAARLKIIDVRMVWSSPQVRRV